MLVDRGFKSFFALLKKKQKGEYDQPIQIPHYLPINGRQTLEYEKGALSFMKEGFIHLSKTEIYIPSTFPKEDVQTVRIVPKNGYIVVEVLYKREVKKTKENNNRVVGIDIGVNNLAAVVSNVFDAFIINGRPLKSINQFFNKELASAKSDLKIRHKRYKSKRTNRLWRKRTNKVNDYLQKASTYLVNQFVSNDITTVVIGYNKNWKQDINMGKKNNQNFVQIPFRQFINMVAYKCYLEGITVYEQEESYTSKCSFLDGEPIQKHEKYRGRRVKRGLYKTSTGKLINADVNGACNILKKFLLKKEAWNEEISSDLVEVCSTPSVTKITVNFS
jgi:transposase, IS605 orfB family